MRPVYVLLCASLAAGAALLNAQQREPALEQNWSSDERIEWEQASQGSRLIPYIWLKALQTAEARPIPFLDPSNIAKFRYLPGRRDLPLGFAVDDRPDEKLIRTRLRWYASQGDRERWVGMTCSACHTTEIDYGSRKLTVDGAGGMGDFQSFVEALNAAMKTTYDDPQRWARFAGYVERLTPKTDPVALRTSFKQLLDWEMSLAKADATSSRYGFARLDAFGHIYNKVALAIGAEVPGSNPPDAPVSYPFLWGIADERRLQWNGSVTDKPTKLPATLDFGALGRNAGEVIGVFGEIYPKKAGKEFGSSVYVDNLNAIEHQLYTLSPPIWTDILPPLSGKEAAAVVEGEHLYTAMCASCHVRPGVDHVPPPRPEKGYEDIRLFHPKDGRPAIDTDDRMACNAYFYSAPSGMLQGATYTAQDPKTGAKVKQVMGPTAPLGSMLPLVVGRAIGDQKGAVAKIIVESAFNKVPAPHVATYWSATISTSLPGHTASTPVLTRPDCKSIVNDNLGYKARPLNGIWSTAPYLHNGSVPNLYEMLLAPTKRSPFFYEGSFQYDPERAGRDIKPSPSNSFKFDTSLPGNSNLGHDYGVGGLHESQRFALLQYLKTL